MSNFPANYTLRVEPGDTYSRTLLVKSGGVAVDLTGYTVRLKAWDSTGTDLFILTIGSGITVTPLTGAIQFVLTPAQTLLLRYVEQGWYRLKITAPDTSERTLIKGRITSNHWDGDLSDES